MIHMLLGMSLHHLQAYPSGSQLLLLLAKPKSWGCIFLSSNLWQKNSGSFSISLLADNYITPLQVFLIITFKLSLTNFCCAHPGMPHICHNFTLRGAGTRNSLIPLPLVSVSSDEGWQFLLPGTLVLLAGPIGLMVTQTTEVNKIKVGLQEVTYWE